MARNQVLPKLVDWWSGSASAVVISQLLGTPPPPGSQSYNTGGGDSNIFCDIPFSLLAHLFEYAFNENVTFT